MKDNLSQTPEQIESLNKHIEDNLKQYEEDNDYKKLMSVDIIQFLIHLPAYNYIMSVVPKGKGYYNIRVVEKNKTGKIMNDGQLNDYFSHSMSMNRAKDILLIFLKDWDN